MLGFSARRKTFAIATYRTRSIIVQELKNSHIPYPLLVSYDQNKSGVKES
jgi:hypothetical protein